MYIHNFLRFHSEHKLKAQNESYISKIKSFVLEYS